jgi:hypothetical protein
MHLRSFGSTSEAVEGSAQAKTVCAPSRT